MAPRPGTSNNPAGENGLYEHFGTIVGGVVVETPYGALKRLEQTDEGRSRRATGSRRAEAGAASGGAWTAPAAPTRDRARRDAMATGPSDDATDTGRATC